MSISPLIVCFGDSLTSGFQSPTIGNPQGRSTPYGARLQELMGGAARVRVSGLCGEVTGEMVLRFRHDVLDHHPAYVVILGGTNDLGWNAAPREIMRNLLQLYERTCAIGGVPIPVTVPSIRVETGLGNEEGDAWLGAHVARRQELNRLIQEYARGRNLPCIDLFTATAEPETFQLAEVYSNDGIHLTDAGYQVFAQLVAQVLRPLCASKERA
jgi:lysophospholipase L1-like esterase